MPPSACSNLPAPGAQRAGEGALFVPEQLALDQLVRHGSAVDRHPRRAAALALGVDGARHHLLAGAGLAGDQHAARSAGAQADLVARPSHRHALAQQLPADASARFEFGAVRFEPPDQERIADQEQDPLGGERLLEEVVRAELGRPDGVGDGRVRRHHHHGDIRLLADIGQDLDAVAVGQADVEEHEVAFGSCASPSPAVPAPSTPYPSISRVERSERSSATSSSTIRISPGMSRSGSEAYRVETPGPGPGKGVATPDSGREHPVALRWVSNSDARRRGADPPTPGARTVHCHESLRTGVRGRRAQAVAALRAGIPITNAVPGRSAGIEGPAGERATTVHPWSVQILYTIASPSPVPSALRVK